MNRAEATRQVLLVRAARDQLDKLEKELRSALDADARAELVEHGTAPTWRLDIGTWTLPVSKETAYVADEAALLAWVKERNPTEVETTERIRPAFLTALLGWLDIITDEAIVPDTGEVVPGVGVRPGGQPQALRFRAAGDAQAVADQHAEQLVKGITAGLGITDA